MERRLLRVIINPAMIAIWVFGLTLAWLTGAYHEHWLQLKFVLVVVMCGLHGYFARPREGLCPGRERQARPLLPDPERGSARFDGRSSSSW